MILVISKSKIMKQINETNCNSNQPCRSHWNQLSLVTFIKQQNSTFIFLTKQQIIVNSKLEYNSKYYYYYIIYPPPSTPLHWKSKQLSQHQQQSPCYVSHSLFKENFPYQSTSHHHLPYIQCHSPTKLKHYLDSPKFVYVFIQKNKSYNIMFVDLMQFRDTRNHNLLKWTQLRSGTNAKGRVPNKDNTKIMGERFFILFIFI